MIETHVIYTLLGGSAIILATLTRGLLQPRPAHVRCRGNVFRLLLLLPTAAVFLYACALAYFRHRPQPPPEARELYPGVVYRRFAFKFPRPIVAHVVEIDLKKARPRFLVTPPATRKIQSNTGPEDMRAQTTSEFARGHKVDLAINGDFFKPWHYRGPWNYYPAVGDPVSPLGFALSNGKTYGRAKAGATSSLYITRDNQVRFDDPRGAVHALSGHRLFLCEGRFFPNKNIPRYYLRLHPRSAIALNRSRDRLLLVTVDGRQRGYSEGVSIPELALFLSALGAYQAMNLDGGGS